MDQSCYAVEQFIGKGLVAWSSDLRLNFSQMGRKDY